MSQQRSLEQKRATIAWEAVTQVKGQSFQDKYKSLAANAPADIQTNGLGQTLAFWKAKGGEEHRMLYQAVSVWVKGQLNMPATSDFLVWVMQTATTDQYRRATAEAIAFLSWLKRFAEAELGG
ncbi:MAG: type III-B CRISPR module-associated protein Cmr5 [Anaerolineae bacterium]|nr:type III-B CRISPR module-associated protein Cmr5 [Anaerolineae bacterium]